MCSSSLFGVICQETLAEDCLQLLGVRVGQTIRRHNNMKHDSIGALSPLAIKNLKRYLMDDYLSIASLWTRGLINDEKFKILMFDNLELASKSSLL